MIAAGWDGNLAAKTAPQINWLAFLDDFRIFCLTSEGYMGPEFSDLHEGLAG